MILFSRAIIKRSLLYFIAGSIVCFCFSIFYLKNLQVYAQLSTDCGYNNPDLDCSGTVDITDLSILLSLFGSTNASRADLNHSGTVDISDLSILLQHFGETTTPLPKEKYFTIQVKDETFCLYSTNQQTIQDAIDNFYNRNNKHPSGPIVSGNGGFNYGYGGLPNDKYNRWWSWHLDPQETIMVDKSKEVCDGLPSSVEYGPFDNIIFCPWNAKVTALSCESQQDL